MKLLDWCVGRILLFPGRFRRPAEKPVPEEVNRVLIIRPGGLGDAVLLVPMIRQLKETFPQATIDVLAEGRNAGVFKMAPDSAIRRVYCYDTAPWRWWGILKADRYDLVFDTEQWHLLNAFIAASLNAPCRIGFDTNPLRRHCYTKMVAYRHDEFEGISFLNMLRAVTGRMHRWDWSRPFLALPREEADWARRLLEGRNAAAVALGGSIRERRLEEGKLLRLVSLLLERGFSVCLIGSKQEAPLAERIEGSCQGTSLINMAGKTSILQTAALLRASTVFIGADSGLMHLAYGLGTPVVALFGSGIEEKWAPPGGLVRVLNRHLPCSPCTRFGYTPACPIHVRCLQEIPAQEIAAAASDLLLPRREG
ncbi:MAG: glycosyltransferase family 9 protein [Candidatus Omnitrophica bacterium]|nr:glycosyltransferase family 9 protein [Candidatus Omnitrophota bacterium]